MSELYYYGLIKETGERYSELHASSRVCQRFGPAPSNRFMAWSTSSRQVVRDRARPDNLKSMGGAVSPWFVKSALSSTQQQSIRNRVRQVPCSLLSGQPSDL